MYQICKNQFEYKNLLKVNFFDEFFLCAVSNDSSETENGSAQALHTHTIMKIKMFFDENSLELIAAEKKNTLQVLEYKRSKSNHSKNVVWGRNNAMLAIAWISWKFRHLQIRECRLSPKSNAQIGWWCYFCMCCPLRARVSSFKFYTS